MKSSLKKLTSNNFYNDIGIWLDKSLVVNIDNKAHIKLPEDKFWKEITAIIKEKNNLEKEMNEEELFNFSTNFIANILHMFAWEREEYECIKGKNIKSKIHYQVNKAFFSLTALYGYKTLSLVKDSVLYQNGQMTKKTVNEFSQMYEIINLQVANIKRIAELEGVSLEDFFKHILKNKFHEKIEALILSNDFWNYLKKESNEEDLLMIWDKLSNYPQSRLIPFIVVQHSLRLDDRSISIEKEAFFNWARNIPIELLTEKRLILYKDTPTTMIEKEELPYQWLKEFNTLYMQEKRVKELNETLNHNVEKIEQNRVRRRV